MSQERTEAPSQRRLRELGARGTSARSQDLATAVTLLAGVVALQQVAPYVVGQWIAGIRSSILNARYVDLQAGDLSGIWSPMTTSAITACAAVLVPVAAVALVTGLFQTQGRIAFAIVRPNPGRLNPGAGVRRLFGLPAAGGLIWPLLKVVVVSAAISGPLRSTFEALPAAIAGGVGPQVGTLASALLAVARNGAGSLVLLAVFDIAYRRWQFLRQARMTRREVREELRQNEGDPTIRARLRAAQRRIARNRMLHRVPQARVVVVNPTHYAVALAYETGRMAAPEVVAKGADLVAQKIIEIARENRVPVVPNAPLARALYRTVEIGEPIPTSLYQAIAEVLAYVYSLRPRS